MIIIDNTENRSERFGRNCFQVLFFPEASLGLLRNKIQAPEKFLKPRRKRKNSI